MVFYSEILDWMKNREVNFCTIKDFNPRLDMPNVFIRHDLDAVPESAIWMLVQEEIVHAKSITYVFPNKYPKELKEFEELGWEIGLHCNIVVPTIGFIDKFKQQLESLPFDVFSYSFHGKTDLFKDNLNRFIKEKFEYLYEFVSFMENRHSVLHISDSMSKKKWELNRRFFFHWKIDVPPWFPRELLHTKKIDDSLLDYRILKECIYNMRDGEIYAFLFHPQSWDKKGKYIRTEYKFNGPLVQQ